MSEYKQTTKANPLQYKCLDDLQQIIDNTSDQNIKYILGELRELIHYQIREIHRQRQEIIAIKHKEAWKQYD